MVEAADLQRPFDRSAFARLQSRLQAMWPAFTISPSGFADRVVVVIPSLSLPYPPAFGPVVPSYEERYLFYLFTLAHAERSRVVYVTSQPILPRILDYYVGMLPPQMRAALDGRLTVLSVGDASDRPLTTKILCRPRLLERLRAIGSSSPHAVIVPFVLTALEANLGPQLDVPVYGPHPDLGALGTKTGSRRTFEAAGVPHPRGVEDLTTVDELIDAAEELLRDGSTARLIVKTNDGATGIGNAELDLAGVETRSDIAARVRGLAPELDTMSAAEFLATFEREGGIVEERIGGRGVRSPSVQLRVSPYGEVEVLSTHDQVLGGPRGLTFLGCRFPADAAYRATITRHAVLIGEQLARSGVIGRFAIDFVVRPTDQGWESFAIEINLRNGGTTHPAITLIALTGGTYDVETGEFHSDGTAKSYVATDHLERREYAALTPDDAIDIIEERHLQWNADTKTGVAFHMISAIAAAGRIGVTAIGDTRQEADALFVRTRQAFDAAVA